MLAEGMSQAMLCDSAGSAPGPPDYRAVSKQPEKSLRDIPRSPATAPAPCLVLESWYEVLMAQSGNEGGG